MKSYIVTWVINLDADTPEEAALIAYGMQQDPTSLATVFLVDDVNDARTVVDTERYVATVIRKENNNDL